MRTTVDLDERVLAAARAKSSAEHVSLGRALSDLVLETLDRPVTPAGFPVFPRVKGHVITTALVTKHRDDE